MRYEMMGGTENKEWVVGVGEDGKVRVHGYATVDRSGSEIVDGGWIVFEMTAEYQLKKMQRLVKLWA